MVSPKWNPVDRKAWIADIGSNYAKAIKDAGVKYVVNLSSIGAHMPESCGPVSGLYSVEAALNALEDVNTKHLRAGYFYHNLFAKTGMIQHAGINGWKFWGKPFSNSTLFRCCRSCGGRITQLGFHWS
jgi:hypothetical protein